MIEAEKKRLQEKAIASHRELPVYKYTAMAIGVHIETLINWRKEDSKFSNQLQEARVEWVKKKAHKARAEFTLERLEREVFAPPTQEIEVKGETAVDKIIDAYLKMTNDPDDTRPKKSKE